MPSKDAYIGAQVIVKEVGAAVASGVLDATEDATNAYANVLKDLLENVAVALESTVAETPTAPAAAAASVSPGSAAPAAAPATPASGSRRIKKLNESLGIPDWFDSVVGSVEVWDNRSDLPKFGGSRNPRSPWFKAVDGGDGFWPPKGHADAA